MSQALYRRYRPETFADVIGQEHVTGPLQQALRTGRVNHAYLFSGPRGCGKTTSARILARCLNCEQGPTDTPCGTCDSCVALARGGAGTVDVIEIDAASHGGVDDARELRERASYGPAQSRYKIYIIDEAHMVTTQGFNALLKIVEEPPEHVKFVFATTEPEKVIGTIRSRTHHYPFRLVPPAQLQDYLASVCASEGVQVEPGVLSFVVRAGGGSVRDSLSVLDQLMAGSGPEGLTYDSAAALLGFTDGELLDATVTALGYGDAAAAFAQVDRVIETGLDPRRFVEDLLERLRDLIICAAIPDGAEAVLRTVPADQLERMYVQAGSFGPGALSRAADVVNSGLTEMTGTTSPRLQLELIIARLLLPGAAGPQGYAARLDRIERRLDMWVREGEAGAAPAPARAPSPAPAAGPAASAPAAPAPGPGPGARVGAGAGVSSPEAAPDSVSAPVGGSAASGPAARGSADNLAAAGAPTGAPPSPDAPAVGTAAARDDAAPTTSPGTGGQGAAEPGAGRPGAGGPAVGGSGAASRAGEHAGGDDPARATGGPGAAGPHSRANAGGSAPAAPGLAASPTGGSGTAAAGTSGGPVPAASPAAGRDQAAIVRAWPDILDWLSRHKRVTWTLVSASAQPLSFDGTRLVLAIETAGLAETFRKGTHAAFVQEALMEVLGIDARVEGITSPNAPDAARTGASAGGPITSPWARTEPATATPGTGSPPAASPAPERAAPDRTQGTPAPDGRGAPSSSDVSAAPAVMPHAAAQPPTAPASPSGGGDWSSAPPPSSSAPSWATDDADPLESAPVRTAPHPVTALDQPGLAPVVPIHSAIPAPTPPVSLAPSAVSPVREVVDDPEAISEDDEDIESTGEVGQAVVERLLGGTVIKVDEDD